MRIFNCLLIFLDVQATSQPLAVAAGWRLAYAVAVGQARSTVVTVCGADLQFPSPQNSASASATENFDTYRNLQPHRAVLPAIAWHLVLVELCVLD